MKEIDFLPDWYRQKCTQSRKYHDYYIAIGLIIVIMIAWNIFARAKVAAVMARNQQYIQARRAQGPGEIEYSKAQITYSRLVAKADILKSIETKVKISNILAELSHLTGDEIVLSSLEIKAEPFGQTDSKSPGKIRVAGDAAWQKSKLWENKCRFNITLVGVASGAAQVAQLITNLEKSDYFRNVTPGFSKNSLVDGKQVSEFQISCCLANYKVSN